MRNRRRDALARQETVRGSLGHAMRAGCHAAEAFDHFAKSFVQLMRVRTASDFQYVRNCLWWSEYKADAAFTELDEASR